MRKGWALHKSTYSINSQSRGKGATAPHRASLTFPTKAPRQGLNLVGKRPKKQSAPGVSKGAVTGAKVSGQGCSHGHGGCGHGHLDPKMNDTSKQ